MVQINVLDIGFTPQESRESESDAIHRLIDVAQAVEDLGLHSYAVGERHFGAVTSAPAVLLGAIGERTSRIGLLTGVATINLHDPVRAAEEYATADQISRGRVEPVLSRGYDPLSGALFGIPSYVDASKLYEEKFLLFRQVWTEQAVTWRGSVRPPLDSFTLVPQPANPSRRVWVGSVASASTVEFAARAGAPIFSAHAHRPRQVYIDVVDRYRQTWREAGREPAAATVGIGAAQLFIADSDLLAADLYRDAYAHHVNRLRQFNPDPPYPTIEDAIRSGSYLIGAPETVASKIVQFHDDFGYEVLQLRIRDFARPVDEILRSLERFAREVLPIIEELRPGLISQVPPDTAAPVHELSEVIGATTEQSLAALEPAGLHQ